jgi:hypothetical protein
MPNRREGLPLGVKRRIAKRLWLLVYVLAGVTIGCASAPPPAPETVTVACKQPTFSPLAETKESQEKGGIVISVAPSSYSCEASMVRTRAEVAPSFGELLLAKVGRPQNAPDPKLIEETDTPVLQVKPERLNFQIRISNKLSRVFRGAGAVVLYNFGGKNQQVEKNDYAELENIIVPPRTEAQVSILGPPISQLGDHQTLGLFIYDIVTKTDAAGNILEKQNFEWYYNYGVQSHEDTRPIARRRGWVG